ncbi:hypothetical protein SAMN05421638_0893 [Kaistella treverensis]|uniref:Lipoprotein n=1 Tax=Kaistella treverensis TaxID=631455 RepID=A0A1I3KMB9_9FLAO|nr:hypothetical protein [Kaistella treverensis]SFI73629.1 hypothetical protein SAMN05421638_0893 [Kaistella treverensis]
MKGYILLLFLVFISCEKQEKSQNTETSATALKTEKSDKKTQNFLELTDWFKYYKEKNPAFSAEKFTLQQTSPLSYGETSVKILNQKGFNEIYAPFFIFNESKDNYLDIDSYHWIISPDGYAGFEADQQIVLVDIKKKEARQIAFYGPSFRIEDAVWKGDSVAVLLGNSYEKVPFKVEFNFPKNLVKNYQYSDTLKFEKPFSEIRLEKKGIKIN